MSSALLCFGLLLAPALEPRALDLRMDAGPPGAGLAFVDVGQGASMVALSDEGDVLIVDSGPRRGVSALLDVLVWSATRRVALWVHTHFDSDHLGAFALAVRGPDDRSGTADDLLVDALWDRGSAGWPQHDAATAYGQWLAEFTGAHASAPGTIWWGPNTWVELSSRGPADASAENERGLALCATVAGLRVFVQGDLPGESALGAARNCGPVDVWWLGHHGSDDAVDPGGDIVGALDPRLVVISAGQSNHYCHPSFTTLQRLAERRVAILGLPEPHEFSSCSYDPRSWSQRHELMPQGVWVSGREEGAKWRVPSASGD